LTTPAPIDQNPTMTGAPVTEGFFSAFYGRRYFGA
jgi:hypothetical protein